MTAFGRKPGIAVFAAGIPIAKGNTGRANGPPAMQAAITMARLGL